MTWVRLPDVEKVLLKGLKPRQKDAVRSGSRRELIVAGAGSGKTEVMARRVGWWVAVREVQRDSIVAFTFTEKAAEEMKFRIRARFEQIAPADEDVTLGGMYIGTIHGFCIKLLRELRPDHYYSFDIIDEAARLAVVQRSYHLVLGLSALERELTAARKASLQAQGKPNQWARVGQYETIDYFLRAYDLLNEYNELDVALADDEPPHDQRVERDWCAQARLRTKVGSSAIADAFAVSAARYYAYLRCRRFLDFSTAQSEAVRLLQRERDALAEVRERFTHLVVDEVQDINDVQDELVRAVVGPTGHLTAVGDHRQAIFSWRGGRVDIMGRLHDELKRASDGEVVELEENFRSTPRIIDVANQWARTIGPVGGMGSPDMAHGRKTRTDLERTHVVARRFGARSDEAAWIAKSIRKLVRADGKGAWHDTDDAGRGLSLSDVAILIRTSTDARTYMDALRVEGIDAVFRAGPDLFSQPEVLLFVACMARMADVDQFYGAAWDQRSLPNRMQTVLACLPQPDLAIPAACSVLRGEGLTLDDDTERRLLLATELVKKRIVGEELSKAEIGKLRTRGLVDWLRSGGKVRRIFPQTLFHYVLAEAGISAWDAPAGRGASAMFHLGQLSALITQMETPGWTSADEFKYQVIALGQWGTQNARTDEAPLLVPPSAVTITTIHSAKGLEFSAVFIADVCALRFPSSRARVQESLPFDGPILSRINSTALADNGNYDNERRLMYVALTRGERFLSVTASGSSQSRFFREVTNVIGAAGGTTDPTARVITKLSYVPSEYKRSLRLVSSFSALRYYLECPHDFYLRKVLGFAPTIDQAFGYGRGVHNLMRAIHSDPKRWAALAKNDGALQGALQELIDRGLFYLRYTVGEPADNMRKKALKIVAAYVSHYVDELARLQFEPERPFETLIEEEQVLIAGAIDVIRLDDPPRVTIVDFKSGDPDSDAKMMLDEEQMRLQVSLYGIAAKRELEYEPDRGLVRYVGEDDPDHRELQVDLNEAALTRARERVVHAARRIKSRTFHEGPAKDRARERCARCDFLDFCGLPVAAKFRAKR